MGIGAKMNNKVGNHSKKSEKSVIGTVAMASSANETTNSLTEYHPALDAMGVDVKKFSTLWENLSNVPGMYDVDIGFLEMEKKKEGNMGILCLGQDCNPKHIEKILSNYPGLKIIESKLDRTKMKLGEYQFVQTADICCTIGKNSLRINLVEKD